MPNVYGRARRITILKIVLILFLVVFLVGLGVKIFLNRPVLVKENKNFLPLRNYLVGLGYSCDDLDKSGGQCTLQKENRTSFFHRYDEGFSYTVQSRSYTISINHVKNMSHEIILTTNEYALLGNRNKRYTCTTKDSSLLELDSCKTVEGELLDTETYIGAVESSLLDVKTMLEASGFAIDVLLTDYVWQ